MAEVAELQIDIRVANLERKLKKADTQIRKLGTTATATQKKVQGATAGMGAGFKRLGALIGTYFGIRGLLGAVNVIKDFESSMSGVRAVTQATDNQMKAMRDTARSLGATTAFSATEAAKGMEFLGMAGFETDQIIAALPATLDLAAAGMLDLGTAADIASNILSGFALPAAEMGRVSDVLATTAASANTSVAQLGDAMKFAAPISAALGVEIEDTAVAIGLLSNAGIQGGEAGTTLRRVMLSLVNPSRGAKKALKDYGFELEDVNIATQGFLPVIEKLAAAQIDAASAAKIFEARGVSGFSAITSAVRSGDMQKLADIMGDVEGRAAEMARIRLDNLAGDMRLFKSALDEVILSLGDAGAGGALRRLVQSATKMLRKLDDNFNSIEYTVLEVWDAVTTATEDLLLFLARGFQNGANTINDVWEYIREGGELTAGAIQNAFIIALDLIIQGIDKVLQKMNDFAPALSFVPGFEGLQESLEKAKSGIAGFAPEAVDLESISNQATGRRERRRIQQNLGVDTLQAGVDEARAERAKLLADNVARRLNDAAMEAAATYAEGVDLMMNGPGGSGSTASAVDQIRNPEAPEDMVNRFGFLGEDVDDLRKEQRLLLSELNDETKLAQMTTEDFALSMEALGEISNEVERQLATNAVGMADAFEIGFNRATASFGTFAQRLTTVGESLGLSLESNISEGLFNIIDGTMSVQEAFANMAQSIVQDLIKVMVQQLIVKSIMSAFGGGAGGGGGGLAAIFHEGGDVGGAAPTRSVGAGTFTGRSKFEDGGLAGDEVPIIAHRGEEILTEEESAAKAAGAGGGGNVEIMNVVDPRMVDERISQNPDLILNIITAQKNTVRRILGS